MDDGIDSTKHFEDLPVLSEIRSDGPVQIFFSRRRDIGRRHVVVVFE
jgi:hypothetical protein